MVYTATHLSTETHPVTGATYTTGTTYILELAGGRKIKASAMRAGFAEADRAIPLAKVPLYLRREGRAALTP